jgi:AcrR family transcriptional regulator
MPRGSGGRPRDAQLDLAILDATRALLIATSYAELSMESVAARAGVGKKTLYRRWPSKAPLVAEAVLDAYGRNGSFPVPDTGDIRADLLAWLVEHTEFIAEPANAALIRALVAAAAANPVDNEELGRQLSMPQHDGLMTRLRRAAENGEVRPDADLDAIADGLIGALLLRLLTRPAPGGVTGLLDAVLIGVTTLERG